MAVIRFQEVGFRVGSHELVAALTLEVQQGETLVLLGRSGSGKTTTLKLINHLLAPTSGSIEVQGKDTRSWDPIQLRRGIGYVIQEVGLFPHFNVQRNVGLVPSLQGWEPARIEARAREVMRLVGLDPDQYAGRYPHELSGGQRQRVGVARALAADPAILLMDEPFGALDPITRSEIQKEFRDLQSKLKKTVVFVTHDVAEAFLLATRIALMKDGKLIAEGPPQRFAASDDPEARAFLQPFREIKHLLM